VAEREFVDRANASEKTPKGWPAALVMFHIAMSRERLRNALIDEAEGRHLAHGGDIDEINAAELPNGIGTPLADAAARADHLLSEIAGLYERVGERPFQYFATNTTTEAVLGSYIHERVHFYEYLRDNGDLAAANKQFEETAADLEAVPAPTPQMASAIYNVACARVNQGRPDEAIDLLRKAFEMRPRLRELAPTDVDLEALREDPRFQELIKERT
jgi:tetratricopeptide (TPR) repeat protein